MPGVQLSQRVRRVMMAGGLAALCVVISGADALAQDRVLWRFQMESTFSGRYVGVGDAGSVYVSDDLNLYALDSAGSLRWTLPGAGDRRPIVLGADGTLYVSAEFGRGVLAVDPDGTILWQFSLPGVDALVAGPAIGPDGNIYAVQNVLVEGGLGAFSLDLDGNLLWSEPGDPAVSSFQGGNSTVLFGAPGDDRLYFGAPTSAGNPAVWAMDLGGSQQWTTFETECSAMPEVDIDGHVILVKQSCDVRVFGPNQELIWSATPPVDLFSPARPAVGPDGAIYTTNFIGDVWAINPDGSTRWFTEDVAFGLGNLGVAPDSSVIIGGRKGSTPAIVGLNPEDGQLLWEVPLPRELGLPQLVESAHAQFSTDGRVAYVTTRFASDPGLSYLYAVLLDDSPAGVETSDGVTRIIDYSARPNPFVLETEVSFALAEEASTRITVHDVRGRTVATLLRESVVSAGAHQVTWSGQTDSGGAAPPGLYFVRLMTGSNLPISEKVLLVR